MKAFTYSIIIIVLIFLGIFTYSNSLNNDFLLDDFPTLIENPTLETASFLHLDPTHLKKYAYFRPVTHLLNLITFKTFGLNTFLYHITNLILLILSCLCLYHLIFLIFFNRSLALLTSVFFFLHPINGVLVNYKNATGFGVLILSMNLSLIFFLLKENSSSKRFLLILSLIFQTIALLCHEIVVAYPLYLIAILYFGKKYDFSKIINKCLPSILVTFIYLIFRSLFTSLNTRTLSNIELLNVSITEYLTSYLNLIFWYFKKLLFLDGIVLFWETPIIQTNIIYLILLILLISISVYCLFIGRRKNSIATFSISWIIIGLLPVIIGCVSRIEFGMIIEPHWLFYSSIGFCLLLSYLLIKIKEKLPVYCFYILLIIFSTAYFLSTRYYNYLWGNQVRYCTYWTEIMPTNTFPNHWLAQSYMKQGKYKQAKQYFTVLAEKNIERADVYGCLGLIYFEEKYYSKALDNFLTALKYNPKLATTHYNLGLTYLKMNNKPMAKMHFQETLRLDKNIKEAQELLNTLL